MQKGEVFEHTFTVTEQVYKGFITLFGDRNPLHTDAAFAASKGFGAVMMHGNILNGFLSYFIGECLPLKNVMIQTQEIKYVKPVFLGDRLRFQATVSDVFDSVSVTEIKFIFSKEDGTKAATGKITVGIL